MNYELFSKQTDVSASDADADGDGDGKSQHCDAVHLNSATQRPHTEVAFLVNSTKQKT